MPRKRSASAIARNNQRKGKVYAKHIAQYLAQHMKMPPEELYTSIAGLAGDDISFSRAARAHMPFSIECKCCNTINMPAWIRQAQRQAEIHSEKLNQYLAPLIIFKTPGTRQDMVCLELKEFLRWVV